jgi:hypothetical protein
MYGCADTLQLPPGLTLLTFRHLLCVTVTPSKDSVIHELAGYPQRLNELPVVMPDVLIGLRASELDLDPLTVDRFDEGQD